MLQLDAYLSQADHPNNSERLFGTGSGPPKTDVVERWSRGGPGLWRAHGWRDLLLAFRSDGVVVPAWSVGTEGSERGRLCWAVACRPLAFGPAIRVVHVALGGGGPVRRDGVALKRPTRVVGGTSSARGPVCRDGVALKRPTPLRIRDDEDAGRFERHIDVENALGPPPMKSGASDGELFGDYPLNVGI